MRKPAWLKRLKFTRVDLVGKGANQDGSGAPAGSHVVLFKSADDSQRKANMPDKPKLLAELSAEDVLAKAQELETELETRTTEIVTLTKSVEDLTTTVTDLKAAAEPKKKGADDPPEIPEHLQKLFDDQTAATKAADDRSEVLQKQVAAELELRLNRQ